MPDAHDCNGLHSKDKVTLIHLHTSNKFLIFICVLAALMIEPYLVMLNTKNAIMVI